jgi:hypothetical protein
MGLLIGDFYAKLYKREDFQNNSMILRGTVNGVLARNEARLENFLASINAIIRHNFPTLCYT